VGEEPVTVEVESSGTLYGKPIYDVFDGNTLQWDSLDGTFWVMDVGENPPTLSEDTPCPFGTYTIEEGSIFEAFEVEPCTIPNPYVESINCYKLAVWSKQCEYSKCALEYVNNLIFGIDVCKLEESLKEQRRVLEILNCYDPRDIPNNTVIYNTIPYGTIKKLLYK
jgi:hypothetical protein